MDYIAEHYGDYDLSLQKIADVLGMHPVYLSSSFKEQCGENISDRITKMRLTRSVELLRNGLTVNETAKSVGYINTRTFSDAFRRYYGQTPSKIFEQDIIFSKLLLTKQYNSVILRNSVNISRQENK